MSKKRSLFCILLSFILVFQTGILTHAASDVAVTGHVVPIDAETYANAHYREALEVIKQYQQYYQVSNTELEDAKLGIPFVIYEPEKPVQDEIYYYPILDAQDNVILIMSIMGTTKGWNLSVSEEWVDSLKKVGSITSDFIFYKLGDNLYAENAQRRLIISGQIGSKANISSFQYETFQNKKRSISEINTRFVKVDTQNIKITKSNQYDTYAPDFSTSTSSSKICALYNEQGQGPYGLFWAASVATICNYLMGTNLTAINIADRMGIGYDDGGGLNDAQLALKSYGLLYNNVLDAQNRMSWSNLKSNIDYKYPVYVSAKTPDSGHAVTAYGYLVAAGTNYVVLWNSGTESSITATFKSSGTTFTYNNDTYTWTYSISRY